MKKILVLLTFLSYNMLQAAQSAKFLMLDSLLRQHPEWIAEVINIKKTIEELKQQFTLKGAKIDEPTTNSSKQAQNFLKEAKEKLVAPIHEFLDYLHEYQDTFGLRDLVKNSLKAADESKNSILYQFFFAKKADASNYFYEKIDSEEKLIGVTYEFSEFYDHFLGALSKDTKKAYALWHKEGKKK